MISFFPFLLSNLVIAGCLAVVALSLTRVWRNPHLAHALWLLVLVKLITPAVVRIPLPQFATVYVWPSDGPSYFLGTLGDTNPWQSLLTSWPYWLLACWAIGTIVFASLARRRHRLLLRIVESATEPDATLSSDAKQIADQMGLKVCPPLRMTNVRVGPLVTIGFRRQVILLPLQLLGDLNREQTRSILAHELAHIRRRDHWVRLVELVVLAMHWWNPLAWWASRQFRQAEEECCDAWVISVLPNSRRTYGHALLETVEFLTDEKPSSIAVETSFGGCLFKQRIEAILNCKARRKSSWSVAAMTLVIAVVVLPVTMAPAFTAAFERPYYVHGAAYTTIVLDETTAWVRVDRPGASWIPTIATGVNSHTARQEYARYFAEWGVPVVTCKIPDGVVLQPGELIDIIIIRDEMFASSNTKEFSK